MKTSNKIIAGLIAFMVVSMVANVAVCARRYLRTEPCMQAFLGQLERTDIRVVRFVSDRWPVDSGTTVGIINNPGSRKLIHCDDYPEGISIEGDTLVCPLRSDVTIRIPTVESVVMPDGQVEQVPVHHVYATGRLPR